MVATSRPEWAKPTNGTGIPIDCVVRIHGGTPGARQDILTSRNRVSLVRPGSLQPKPEDEYELSYVYGPETDNSGIHDRTVVPLVKKFIEGYNVTVVLFGATGSGKTTTLEGGRGKDTRASAEGEGIMHLAVDELFELLHGKAVTVGEAVAKKRRMPAGKGFDFFVEASATELYNEAAHDLFQKGTQVGCNLAVFEDVDEGFLVSGLTTRAARNAEELRAALNYGRSNRDTQMMDLGSVHERSAAVYTVWLAQYAPAAAHGEEDRILTSRLTFVDMPGAERLGMDPEVLRLREGLQLNKSLLSMGATLRRLAQDGSTEYVNYDDSALTRLLADALGGNALTAIIGTIRQGDWEQSSTTLKHLTVARHARSFPLINHSRARGLLHKLRFRTLSVMGEFAVNEVLKGATRLFDGQVQGSESVTFAPDGRLVLLDKHARVLQAKPSASAPGGYALDPEPLANLGVGRPLGARFDAQGNLIICDSLKGLIMLPAGSRQPVLLATHISPSSPLHPGAAITYANDLDIASDGRIFFSASVEILPPLSAKGYWDTARGWMLGMFQGAPQGKLLVYDPATTEVTCLADRFFYANGVALAADEASVLVVETDRIRVNRVWLKGKQKGEREVFIDRLPGAPDGISRASDGGFWVGLVAGVPPVMKFHGIRSPAFRALAAWATLFFSPPIRYWGAVVRLSARGEVTGFYTDADGEVVASVSSAEEHGGRLWLGNLHGSYVSAIDLADLPGAPAVEAS